MECSCVPCTLVGRGETKERAVNTRSRRLIVGSVVTQRATDVIRMRCPHVPGCGGCDIHTARDTQPEDRGGLTTLVPSTT